MTFVIILQLYEFLGVFKTVQYDWAKTIRNYLKRLKHDEIGPNRVGVVKRLTLEYKACTKMSVFLKI